MLNKSKYGLVLYFENGLKKFAEPCITLDSAQFLEMFILLA